MNNQTDPTNYEASASFWQESKAPVGAPNILMILTDDVGFAATSTFGGPIPNPAFDELAARGLRYNEFHTTAMCAPTRAALLTGRNHHSIGFGAIPEVATGFPGYHTVLPKTAATIAKVLSQNGYNTAMLGKNHNTPDWETGPTGPFDRWPNGFGFEYFYGFHGGGANQWAPPLVENRNLIEPPYDDPEYILDRDIADKAIAWLQTQHSLTPDKPFLMYLSPGTAHSPHQAPKEWIKRFKGKFDLGWDRIRAETFVRQKQMGIIPDSAELTPRPDELQSWDSLNDDQKKLYSYMMEIYAAQLAHWDYQLGRVIAHLKKTGQYENTIVVYIQGDNGASAEGGMDGTNSDMASMNGYRPSVEAMLSQIGGFGGPGSYNNYPIGWAWAMNTPFKWFKQVASYFGGTRNGLVISWPKRIKNGGQIRSQFHHVIDIVPTLYELIGIPQPDVVDYVPQQPIDGVSMAYTFDDAHAPTNRREQYFEMWSNRAYYKDGWLSSTYPQRAPWDNSPRSIDPEEASWELYYLAEDYSQARDLAAIHPEKLEELKKDFEAAALRYDLHPLEASIVDRTAPHLRPNLFRGRKSFTFYNGPARYMPGVFPDVKNKSWRLTAVIEVPESGAEGVIVSQGGWLGGWGLLLIEGKPVFIYKTTTEEGDILRVSGDAPLLPGLHRLEMTFQYDGGGNGKGGTAFLNVDGGEVGRGRISRTVGFRFTGGAYIGRCGGTSLTDDYKVPFTFNGEIDKVTINFEE